MNIEDTTKDATKVDMTLAPQPKLDLSSIRANVDAIQAEALRLNDIIQAMPKQDSTAKGSTTSPTPMDSTGKMQVPQLQQKTEEQRMAEFQNQRQMSFQAMGITEEDFNKRQNLATQMSSLNAQLQQLDVAEQQAMLDIENLMPGALLSRVRGEQAQVIRTMSFKKAGIAAQMSALSGEYSALQGRIDEAQKFFNQYIEYATFEKKQEMDDYKWALEFYQDIDESEKKWLQQEYENKRSEYEFDVNQKNEEARIKLDELREQRLRQEGISQSNSLKSNSLARILSGYGSLKELTPSERQSVQNEAFELGLYSDSVPEWFTQLYQEQKGPYDEYYKTNPSNFRSAINNKKSSIQIKKLWDEYRKPIITTEEEEEDIDVLIDKYLK